MTQVAFGIVYKALYESMVTFDNTGDYLSARQCADALNTLRRAFPVHAKWEALHDEP